VEIPQVGKGVLDIFGLFSVTCPEKKEICGVKEILDKVQAWEVPIPVGQEEYRFCVVED